MYEGGREGGREGEVKRRLYIAELTSCFETGFEEVAERKRARYTDIAEEAQRQGYNTHILPLQVGSRGVIDSLEGLQSCLKHIPQKKWQAFLTIQLCTKFH